MSNILCEVYDRDTTPSLRVRVVVDDEAPHPRRDQNDAIGHLIAWTDFAEIEDDDCPERLITAIQGFIPGWRNNRVIDCATCNGGGVAYADPSNVPDNAHWETCERCYGKGFVQSLRPHPDPSRPEMTIGRKDGQYLIRCSVCLPYNPLRRFGEVPTCPSCHGDATVANDGWLDLADQKQTFEAVAALDPQQDHLFRLPVWIYDHGIISLQAGHPTNEYDSGHVGFIFLSRDEARERFGTDGDNLKEAANGALRAAVDELSTYLRGGMVAVLCERYTGPRDQHEDRHNNAYWSTDNRCGGLLPGRCLIDQGAFEEAPACYQPLAKRV